MRYTVLIVVLALLVGAFIGAGIAASTQSVATVPHTVPTPTLTLTSTPTPTPTHVPPTPNAVQSRIQWIRLFKQNALDADMGFRNERKGGQAWLDLQATARHFMNDPTEPRNSEVVWVAGELMGHVWFCPDGPVTPPSYGEFAYACGHDWEVHLDGIRNLDESGPIQLHGDK